MDDGGEILELCVSVHVCVCPWLNTRGSWAQIGTVFSTWLRPADVHSGLDSTEHQACLEQDFMSWGIGSQKHLNSFIGSMEGVATMAPAWGLCCFKCWYIELGGCPRWETDPIQTKDPNGPPGRVSRNPLFYFKRPEKTFSMSLSPGNVECGNRNSVD